MALDYGVAFAALKHSFPGDFNWCTRDEVEALADGKAESLLRRMGIISETDLLREFPE